MTSISANPVIFSMLTQYSNKENMKYSHDVCRNKIDSTVLLAQEGGTVQI